MKKIFQSNITPVYAAGVFYTHLSTYLSSLVLKAKVKTALSLQQCLQ